MERGTSIGTATFNPTCNCPGPPPPASLPRSAALFKPTRSGPAINPGTNEARGRGANSQNFRRRTANLQTVKVKPAVIQVLIWCGPGPPRPLNHAAADSPPRSDLQFSQWPDPARIIHLIRTLKAKFFRRQDGAKEFHFVGDVAGQANVAADCTRQNAIMALTISGALHHPRFNENAGIPKVDDGRGGWYRKSNARTPCTGNIFLRPVVYSKTVRGRRSRSTTSSCSGRKIKDLSRTPHLRLSSPRCIEQQSVTSPSCKMINSRIRPSAQCLPKVASFCQDQRRIYVGFAIIKINNVRIIDVIGPARSLSRGRAGPAPRSYMAEEGSPGITPAIESVLRRKGHTSDFPNIRRKSIRTRRDRGDNGATSPRPHRWYRAVFSRAPVL
ncbi:hypothetical protein GEV33_012428 [Tenebrio molitor]|uniref:Uncharacterized protein n=1 Tax=Tenebrio molitor TaxID=7067 RepID=A0A8J6HAU4_TENMO|nr:hypothetical protein GEV33_012428 [Tenebrio molitor]